MQEEGIIVPRVLVVDDDPLVCKTIEVCLTRKGFEVIVADGGEAGMRALEAELLQERHRARRARASPRCTTRR